MLELNSGWDSQIVCEDQVIMLRPKRAGDTRQNFKAAVGLIACIHKLHLRHKKEAFNRLCSTRKAPASKRLLLPFVRLTTSIQKMKKLRLGKSFLAIKKSHPGSCNCKSKGGRVSPSKSQDTSITLEKQSINSLYKNACMSYGQLKSKSKILEKTLGRVPSPIPLIAKGHRSQNDVMTNFFSRVSGRPSQNPDGDRSVYNFSERAPHPYFNLKMFAKPLKPQTDQKSRALEKLAGRAEAHLQKHKQFAFCRIIIFSSGAHHLLKRLVFRLVEKSFWVKKLIGFNHLRQKARDLAVPRELFASFITVERPKFSRATFHSFGTECYSSAQYKNATQTLERAINCIHLRLEFVGFNSLLTHAKALKIGLSTAPKTPLRKTTTKKLQQPSYALNEQVFAAHVTKLQKIFRDKIRESLAVLSDASSGTRNLDHLISPAVNCAPDGGESRRGWKGLAGCKSLDATLNWEAVSVSHSIQQNARQRRLTTPLSMRFVTPGDSRLDESSSSRLSVSRSSIRSGTGLDPPQKRQQQFSCFCRRNIELPPPEGKLEIVLHNSIETDFYSSHSSDDDFLPEIQLLLTPRNEGNLL